MKKVFKIIGLYLFFGLLINVFVSVFGLYTGMTGLGLVTASEYIVISTIIFGICWLPFCISVIASPDMLYFASPIGKFLVVLVIIMFAVLCSRIILNNHNK